MDIQTYGAVYDQTKDLLSIVDEMRGTKKTKEAESNQELLLKFEGKTEYTSVVAERILGEGGSKRALDIGEGRALIIQNMDLGSAPNMWMRMVTEEVGLSRFIYEHGLMGVVSTKVEIKTNQDQTPMPAYCCETFTSLANRNIYIIDKKNRFSSTLNRDVISTATLKIKKESYGTRTLFPKKEDALNPEKWVELLEGEFMNDIARMQKGNIIFEGDSLNIAITTDDHKKPLSVRPYGFDFSSKSHTRSLPDDSTPLPFIKMKSVIKNYISTFTEEELFAHAPGKFSIDSEVHSELTNKVFVLCLKIYKKRFPELTKTERKDSASSNQMKTSLSTTILNAIKGFIRFIACGLIFPLKKAQGNI